METNVLSDVKTLYHVHIVKKFRITLHRWHFVDYHFVTLSHIFQVSSTIIKGFYDRLPLCNLLDIDSGP